jgi:endonuclease-3
VRRSKEQWQGHEQRKSELRKVTLLLEKEFGIPRRKSGEDPLDILMETLLSQNTNDRNRDKAFQRLKKRFPNWEDVFKAKTRRIVSAIRPGGLAEQKAGRIQEILYWIKRREGRLSLSFIRKMNSKEIRETVGILKGIGPKTLHCLLLFGLGREAFPVDTHIHRIGQRLGFIPEWMSAEKAHEWLAPLIPKRKSLSLHLNLIRFGREVCKAKNPQCSVCFLKEECALFQRVLSGTSLSLEKLRHN